MNLFSLDCHRREFNFTIVWEGKRYFFQSCDDSETIGDYLRAIAEAYGIRLSELEIFAGCGGPGSFTGLKSALSFLFGLSGGNADRVRLIPTFVCYEKLFQNGSGNFAVVLPAGIKDYYLHLTGKNPQLVDDTQLVSETSACSVYCGERNQMLDRLGKTYLPGQCLSQVMADLESFDEYRGLEIFYLKSPGITMRKEKKAGSYGKSA
ncbi:MAG: hypothetical protein PHW04_10615 [Candidatus Wallbacteria bacterium]|nr:hypothetical protein [Candidatus Wallbacteria bacterium]